MTFIKRVISGGQTGADQGGLMAAWERGIETGGWCPAGYRTATGPNPLLEAMGLRSTSQMDYKTRTLLNVEQADATILFGYDLSSAGSRLTYKEAVSGGKPVFCFEFPRYGSKDQDVQEIRLIEAAASFLLKHRPEVLNIAGNRDTDPSQPNYLRTRQLFGQVLDLIVERCEQHE